MKLNGIFIRGNFLFEKWEVNTHTEVWKRAKALGGIPMSYNNRHGYFFRKDTEGYRLFK